MRKRSTFRARKPARAVNLHLKARISVENERTRAFYRSKGLRPDGKKRTEADHLRVAKAKVHRAYTTRVRLDAWTGAIA